MVVYLSYLKHVTNGALKRITNINRSMKQLKKIIPSQLYFKDTEQHSKIKVSFFNQVYIWNYLL